MLCCLLAGLLALAGIRARRQPRDASSRDVPAPDGPSSGRKSDLGAPGRLLGVVGFGWCCGVLAFEAVAALATSWGGLATNRPELLVIAATAVTVLGVMCAATGGTPVGRRAWAVFSLGASAGSALAELADLHLLALHRGLGLGASLALHGLAVGPGVVAARLLLKLGREHETDSRELAADAATMAVPLRPSLDSTRGAGNS